MFKVSVFGTFLVHDSVVDFSHDLFSQEVPIKFSEISQKFSDLLPPSASFMEVDFLLLYRDTIPLLKGLVFGDNISWTPRSGDAESLAVLIDSLELHRSRALKSGRSDLASVFSLEIAAQKASLSVAKTSQEVLNEIFSTPPVEDTDELTTRH